MSNIQHVQAIVTREPEVLKAEYQPVILGRHFEITPSGLNVTGDPPIEAFGQLWEALRTLETALQFAIGDAINQMEERFGERAAQIIDATGLSLSSVKVYSWVSKQVPAENRFIDRGLSYSHHQIVAGLSPSEQRVWLRQALGSGEPWSVNRLRSAIREGTDIAPSGWYALIAFDTEEEQLDGIRKLELSGYRCKAVERRAKKSE